MHGLLHSHWNYLLNTLLGGLMSLSAVEVSGSSTVTDTSGYEIYTDVAYGDHEQQTLDIWIAKEKPSCISDRATILFAHGGAYYFGDKSSTGKYISPFLRCGMNVINVNYRTQQGMYIATKDLVAALHFLQVNQVQYGLRIEGMIISGFSAGAHMVSNIGLSLNDEQNPLQVNQEMQIGGILNISGPSHDLNRIINFFVNSEIEAFQIAGKALIADKESKRRSEVIALLEPVNHFDRNDPPFFLWYGGKDDQIPPYAHERMIPLLSTSDKNGVVFVPEGEHSPTTEEMEHLFEEVIQWMERNR
jgi:acetyl esterase/lipase